MYVAISRSGTMKMEIAAPSARSNPIEILDASINGTRL
jgi:hypothetical protein